MKTALHGVLRVYILGMERDFAGRPLGDSVKSGRAEKKQAIVLVMR